MHFGYSWLSALTVQLLLASKTIIGESRFIILPQSQTVVEGDSVVFTCQATPVIGLVYSWTHNSHAVKDSSRAYQVGSNIHLNNVVKDVDAGEYVCIATSSSSGARQASPPAYLNIIWLSSVTVELIIYQKEQITLKCNFDGSEDTTVEWYRNSEKLESIHNIQFEDNKLIIESPTTYDNGIYRCIASNNAGKLMSKKGFTLKWVDNPKFNVNPHQLNGCFSSSTNAAIKKLLKYPAEKTTNFLCRGKRGDKTTSANNDVKFLKHPSKTVAKENEHVVLSCPYNLPEKYKTASVQLKWRKDGKMFRQSELGSSTTTTSEPNMESMIREDTRVTLNRQNGSLIFMGVIASDAGNYDCQIYIEGHSPITSGTGELVVIEQLKFAPQPTSKNLELGSIGKIHCKAQGTPTPQVKWIKDGSNKLLETIEDINGTLIFKNVSASHRGNYTCIASNSQGQINATVNIGVVVAPKFSVAPQGPIHAVEMGITQIHCQATGDPKPTIQWDKDLQYLSDNNTDKIRFKFLENGTLQISEVHLDDEGRYGCTIGNSAGLKREEVRLLVKPSEGFTTEESTDGFMITRAVLITMSVAFAYIILVVGLMLWCRYRRQARKARLNLTTEKENVEAGDNGNNKNAEIEPCLPEKSDSNCKTKVKKVNGNNNPKSGSGTDAQKSDDTISSVNSRASKKSNPYDQFTLPRSSISELIQIGRGEFGDVFIGKIKASLIKTTIGTIEKDNDDKLSSGSEKRKSKSSMDDIEEIKEENCEEADEYKQILVKALNKVKDENVCQEFKRQIEMFRAISHKGVVKFFGLCREKDPHYLILEHSDWGDLKQFLLATTGKSNTTTAEANLPPLKMAQLLAIAYQISRGMDAIYRARYIHKDLAARNCIISSDFLVKISYPALCKDKYSREYHKHRNTLLPIRWLAPECIQEDDYTTKSDIFAFAVFVWELFTQATKLPFEELSNEEYLQKCQSGGIKWECAEGTPEDLRTILTLCWSPDPKERPSFSQLCTALSKSMQSSDK